MYIRLDTEGNVMAISPIKLEQMGEFDDDNLPVNFEQEPYTYMYKDGVWKIKPATNIPPPTKII